MPGAQRDAGTHPVATERPRHVQPILNTGEVPELPDVLRGIGVHAHGGSQLSVPAIGEIPGNDVHHAAESGRAVQGGSRSFDDFHALHAVDRDDVPVDATAITLIGGHAVDEQEDATAEAHDEAGRSADVDLPV